MALGLLVIVLFLARCTETTNILTTAPGPGAGGIVNPDTTAVTSVELFPSFVRVTNGADFTVTVVTKIAGVEVLAPFTASIEGEQIVQILAPSGSSTEQREVLLRARGVGDTTLVVRSGSAQRSCSITVTPASP